MSDENSTTENDSVQEVPQRKFEDLPPPAQRALKEAEERRAALSAEKEKQKREIGGRGGEDPARYGDWEVKGIAIDF